MSKEARFLPRTDDEGVAAVAATLLEMAGRDAASPALQAEAERQARRVIFARQLERRRRDEAAESADESRVRAATDITHATLQRACRALMQPSAAPDTDDAADESAPEVRAA